MHPMYLGNFGLSLLVLVRTLHVLAAISVGTGTLLLLFWAFKHLSEKQLRLWGWRLLIGGVIIALLTMEIMAYIGSRPGMRRIGDNRMMENGMGGYRNGK